MSLRDLDLPLFLVALAVALVIKVAVGDRVQLTERVVDAQVTYSYPRPESQLATFDLVDKVRVGVRGKSGDMSRLSPFSVEVVAAIPAEADGVTTIVLDASDVRFNIPGDFRVESIAPSRFQIQVEQRISRQVPVRADLTGEPSAGSRAETPRIEPPTVRVSGPRSRVDRLDQAHVEISLDGHARTFTDIAAVTTDDPLVQVVAPLTVQVTVPMREPQLSISFEEDEAAGAEPPEPAPAPTPSTEES